jgi:hypothetical protein
VVALPVSTSFLLTVPPEGAAIFTAERMTWLGVQNVTFAQLYFARDYKLTTRF